MSKPYMEGKYRPRVLTLITKNVKGTPHVLALKNTSNPTSSPYNFPGGGTDGQPLIRAAKREALEEVGYRMNGARVIQKPKKYALSNSWRDHIKGKRGVNAIGIKQSIVHGRMGRKDMRLYNSEGDGIEGIQLYPVSEVVRDLNKFTSKHKNNNFKDVHPYVVANGDIQSALSSLDKQASVRVRDYRKEYLRDHAHKEAKNNRVKRNYWNRKIKTPPGKEIDHKVPLSKGGGNGRDNLRVTSVSANRSKGEKTASRYQAFASVVDRHGLNAYLAAKDQEQIQEFARHQRSKARRASRGLRQRIDWRKYDKD